MIFNQRIAIISVATLLAALFLASCSDDETTSESMGGESADVDEEDSGEIKLFSESTGLSSCETLCDATAASNCASQEKCFDVCSFSLLACPDSVLAYFKCGNSVDQVTCFDGVDLGVIPGCVDEALALLPCAQGAGGAGGSAGAEGN